MIFTIVPQLSKYQPTHRRVRPKNVKKNYTRFRNVGRWVPFLQSLPKKTSREEQEWWDHYDVDQRNLSFVLLSNYESKYVLKYLTF